MRLKPLTRAERAEILRARDADLARIAAGWTPSPEALAAVPVISHWVEAVPEGGTRPALIGFVQGHPRSLGGWATTDEVLARGDGWVRTHDALYRLGPPARPRPHMRFRPPEPDDGEDAPAGPRR